MIKVRNLVAGYDNTAVLEDISLEVNPQEILVVMGQSGCGKSTFLRHLIGLQKPLSGTVEIGEMNVTEMTERDYRSFCRRVGVLFQSGGLFNSMTIGDNVAFPLREYTRLAEPVIRIAAKMKLAQVDLRGVEDQMPGELSGGMKKRAGLARALALDPSILFLDEPTTGLDPIISAGIDELILRLRDLYKATMVVVAHDVASSMRVADRIALFAGGRLRALGTPQEIAESPDPFVQRFFQRKAGETDSDTDLGAYLS